MSQAFVPATSFDKLAARGRRIESKSHGVWFSVFDNREDAASLARYVGGFARRVVERVATNGFAHWSQHHSGYLAILAVQYPGGWCEEGPVVCSGHQVAGIVVYQSGNAVLLPVKQHLYTARTKSGSLYISFKDGTAFCRSLSDGPQELAKALYFTNSHSDAHHVRRHGGKLLVFTHPGLGMSPLYVQGDMPTGVGDTLWFSPGSFRVGTPVVSVCHA